MQKTTYTVLITGANRGLGLEFVKQYAADGWQVLACCRDLASANQLQATARQYDNIHLHTLDVGDFSQIDTLAQQLSAQSIDVLINNAGIYPESRTGTIDKAAWLAGFAINSIAPYKMATAFQPHLARSQLKKMATLSSKMGSIDDNTSGGSYMYRSSKTALNMVMKSLSIDWQAVGIAVVTLHPGWVRTDMGGPNGLIDAPASVSGLRKVIAQLTLAETGKFIAYDGQVIPW